MKRSLQTLFALAAAALLNGCMTAQSTLQNYGPASSRISHLSWFMTILFLTIALIMWGLIWWGFAKQRGTLLEHQPIDVRGGEMWVAIGGLVIPLIILTILFVLGLKLLTDFPIHGMHGGPNGHMQTMVKPEIRITGHQWWWQIDYLNDDVSQQFTTANELHLPANRPVNIEVETADVMHSFWIPALHGKVDLIPGHPNFIRLEASQAGEYTGQCAEYCGAQHAKMRLLAVVEDPDSYEAWLQAQLKPAVVPRTEEAIAGQQIFLGGPCSMCHQVRGTLAGGRVAPDLTHIASRRYIAANTLDNNNAYLEAWITHAQSFKPGAQMPDLTDFNGNQLQELVAYLRQLR